MRETLTDVIEKAETTLEEAQVPTRVYKKFFNLYRDTCEIQNPHYEVECEITNSAKESQETLGEGAILKGYLASRWTKAIQTHWKAPQCHPGNDKPPKQRSPYQMGVLLQETVWSIFNMVKGKLNST